MTSKILAAVALLGMPISAGAQSSKAPLVLKPSSAWHVDYADDRCRLARQFGEGKEQVLALFDRYGPGEYFRLTVAGKPVRTSGARTEAVVQFGPTEKEQKLHFFKGNLGGLPALIFTSAARVAPPSDAELAAINGRGPKDDWVDLAPVSDARLKTIRYLTLNKPLQRAITLETGSMRAAFEAANTCIDNLMTTWGIDVERHKSLSRALEPQQSPARWIDGSDYPPNMLFAGQPAIVEFRLSVGADGVPTACHIRSTTHTREFDHAVCKLVMRRARFDPALDAAGKPLASYYLSRVRFQIP